MSSPSSLNPPRSLILKMLEGTLNSQLKDFSSKFSSVDYITDASAFALCYR